MEQSRTIAAASGESRWPHRVAVLLVCATFPLIWVGGLVTTYEAGMAVPDWPTTYGYNLFLYPWQTWVLGPWDLFIEHGHRLLGATVGLLTMGLVFTAFRCDHRPWFRWATVAALGLVIGQGLLGGMRVVLDERLLAQLHGCIGPAFFALTVALAWWSSTRCLAGPLTSTDMAHARVASRFRRLAFFTFTIAYLQLVLGSQLRHVRPGLDLGTFRAAVWLHLLMACVLTIHIALVAGRAVRSYSSVGFILVPALVLAGLVAVQLCLGAGSWVVNYGWPTWFSRYAWAQEFVIQHESRLQAMVTTAHVATGSLILVTSLLVALRSMLLSPAMSQPLHRLVRTEALA